MKWLTPWRSKPEGTLNDEVLGKVRNKSAIANITEKFGVKSLIAYGSVFDGNVSGKDGIAIDGTLNGNVTVTDQHRAVLVRQGGVLSGSITAPIVVVAGEVYGDIFAQNVRLYSTAQVYGRVNSTRMIVDDGARIINDHVSVGDKPANATVNVVGFRPPPAQIENVVATVATQ